VYESARCPIRIEFERRLRGCKFPAEAAKRRLGTRRLGPSFVERRSHHFAMPQRYDRIALAAGSDSVRALFGDFFYA
jgi:hypothetical protein